MTPKEKAEELIDKYFRDENLQWDLSYIQSKQCALIAINEIIQTLYYYHYDSESGAYEYWIETKQQLENL